MRGEDVECEVVNGGLLAEHQGINLPGAVLSVPSLTDKDQKDLEFGLEHGVDIVAVSFVRSAEDVRRVKRLIGERRSDVPVIAKLEKPQALDDLDGILHCADGVMVARGDLGIRSALEDVPHYQKRIILTGVAYGRPVITATQMLESMVHAPVPTRAEVSDVANAVFDGSSALMLSGETAIGADPVAAVATMARIAVRAEREFDYERWGRELGIQQIAESWGAPARVRITAALSAAAWRAAHDAQAAAIIACTTSGATARAISRFRPTVPILAITPSPRTARQLSVAWGITPVLAERRGTTDDIVWFAIKAAVDLGVVKTNDVVAILVGSPEEPEPMTDVLRLVRIR